VGGSGEYSHQPGDVTACNKITNGFNLGAGLLSKFNLRTA
jgi:hypothetical protein